MVDHDDTEDVNALSAWLYALTKDTPAKLWWDAEPSNERVFKALRINKADWGAIYACAPFRLAQIDGVDVVLAAYPAPRLFDDPDYEWLGIEEVLCWHPKQDSATLLMERRDGLFGRMAEEANVIFSSPRAFLQHWAARRAAFIAQRHQTGDRRWHVAPPERDETPGCLIVGNIAKIRWPLHTMPADIACVGLEPQVVNRAILKSARLPRAFRGEAA